MVSRAPGTAELQSVSLPGNDGEKSSPYLAADNSSNQLLGNCSGKWQYSLIHKKLINQASYCHALQTQKSDTKIILSHVLEVLGTGGVEPPEGH